MIFHKSLSKKKGAAYSFFSGLSASFVPAVFLTLFQLLFSTVLPISEFISINQSAKNNISENAKTAKDTFKFLVFGSRDFLETAIIYIVLAAMGVMCILVAIRIFSFICDKRTVNVYYSLGIKRSTLFLTKYLSGALLLCAATAIPVILSYFVNILYLGASWQLSLVLLHLYCGISVFLLICYSVTAAVFSSVGTVSEAVVYSVAVLFAPTVIIYMTEQIIGAFLPSSTLNLYINHFNDSDYIWNSGESLLEATASYNPVLFFSEDILKYSCGIKDGNGILLAGTDTSWQFPNLFIHFPWFIIASAAGLLGAFLFRRIKAENCGFLNTNKVLSNLTIFELCLVGSSIMLGEIQWTETYIVIGIGLAAAFVLYIIAEIFLKRSIKKILVSLYKFVAHIAVIALIYGICATGAFGYDKYIPDKSKIESAEITIPFSYSEFSLKNMDYYMTSVGFLTAYEPFRHQYLPLITDSDDIDTVMEINSEINRIVKDDGLNCDIVIRYNYKNGNFSERRHTLTSIKEVESLFRLRDTKTYKELVNKLFNETDRVEKIKEEASKNHYYLDDSYFKSLCFDYEYSVVTARTVSLQENRTLDLTKEQFNTLKEAVYKDITGLSSEEYFRSSKSQLGVLSFGITDEAWRIEGVNGYSSNNGIVYEEGITSVTTPELMLPDDSLSDDIITDSNDIGDVSPEEDSPYKEDNMLYRGLGSLHSDNTYDVIITEDMKNTLTALNSFGLSDCFSSDFEIESVSFREYDTDKNFSYYRVDTDFILDFYAYPVTVDDDYMYYEDPSFVLEGNRTENIITDTAKVKELDSLMKLHEYTFDTGYYCLVKYKNGAYCIRYLSEEDAPDYVKNFNYVMDENGYY